MKLFNDNNKLNINEEEDIGLPISYKYDLNNFKDINIIYSYLSNEIGRYKKEKHLSNYEPIFGIILRSNNFSNTGLSRRFNSKKLSKRSFSVFEAYVRL